MKNIILLSFSLALAACSSGLPELKYADGSARIPVNPRPIPLTNSSSSTNQLAVITQADKPGGAPATVGADTAKPAAKHGCRRPPEKEKAVGFGGLDNVQFSDSQNQLISYH